MNKEILLTLLISSLLWIILLIFLYIKNKNLREKMLTDQNEKLSQINSEYNKKLESILTERNEELRKSYEKGYAASEAKKELSVQISPWKEEIDSRTLFKNKKSVKVGYKHQLFSNGMPCFEPHITVIEEITLDQLNEEHIKKTFSNLELIMNTIPNTGSMAVSVLGNGKDLANSLLRLTKRKK